MYKIFVLILAYTSLTLAEEISVGQNGNASAVFIDHEYKSDSIERDLRVGVYNRFSLITPIGEERRETYFIYFEIVVNKENVFLRKNESGEEEHAALQRVIEGDGILRCCYKVPKPVYDNLEWCDKLALEIKSNVLLKVSLVNVFSNDLFLIRECFSSDERVAPIDFEKSQEFKKLKAGDWGK